MNFKFEKIDEKHIMIKNKKIRTSLLPLVSTIMLLIGYILLIMGIAKDEVLFKVLCIILFVLLFWLGYRYLIIFKKSKNKRVRLFNTLFILISVIVIGLTFMVVNDLKIEHKLKDDIIYILDINLDDKDKVYGNINKLSSKGNYKEVTKAIKSYLLDYYDEYYDLIDALNDRIYTFASTQNYAEDGPDFVKTLTYLYEIRNKLETNKFTDMYEQDVIDSYVKDKGLDDYSIDLYHNIFHDFTKEQDFKEMKESIDSLVNVLDKIENVIMFLKENKGHWEADIPNDRILLDEDSLIDEYLRLIKEVKEA